MFFTQYFLLLLLIYQSISNANEDDLSKQRIKRFLSRKSSKLNKHKQEDLLFNNGLNVSNNKKTGYTRNELDEINRILSKNENDYYGILGVKNPATREKIMNAYKKLTLRVHPDKFNAPGATEATQRLNKARSELLRRLEYANQNNYQRTTQIRTHRSSTINQDHHDEIIDLLSTFSPLPSEPKSPSSKRKSFFQNTHYIFFGCVLFIIGIIIFIIYWMKRQRRLSDSTDRNYSKKSNDGRTKNRDSEVSILQDDE